MDQTLANPSDQQAGVEAEEAIQQTQESLEKVRDILFGSQMRDQDRRYSQLEEKVAADLAAFREETRKGLATLESFVMAELQSLATRLTTETTQRQEAGQQLSEELKNSSRAIADDCRGTAQRLEKRLGEADQQHAAAEGEIRKELLAATNTLREELKTQNGELHGLVEKLVTELRSAKTDRSALAGLFTEMAGRLQA